MKTKLSFTVKYSERKLDFLDTTIYLEDGKLEFDVYSKPIDSHLYLLPDSCHPKENTENIPYDFLDTTIYLEVMFIQTD